MFGVKVRVEDLPTFAVDLVSLCKLPSVKPVRDWP